MERRAPAHGGRVMPGPNAGNCGRCGAYVPDGEYCWYCLGPLCLRCWEALGHCGHLEAEAANVAGRRAP